MSDRSQRFLDSFRFDHTNRLPVQLLKLFPAKNLKDMMKIAKNYPTDFEALQREAHQYLGMKAIHQCVQFATGQTKLPAECAFAIHAYTRNDFYKELNDTLRNNKSLDEYRHLCICMIKAMALLPAYTGKVYRGATQEQMTEVM